MNAQAVFDKTLFLLGAGASIEAGCKLSDDMLKSLKIKINQFSEPDKKKRYLDIYDFIFACLKFKFHIENQRRGYEPNIEDFVMVLRQLIRRDLIVPRPLIGSWNEQVFKWEIAEDDVFRNFLMFVRRCLVDEWIMVDSKKTRNLLKPLNELINDPEVHSIDIFTLNYDLVFEKGLNSEHSMPVHTGFIRDIWSGFPAQTFNGPQFGAPLPVAPDDSKINYYKLHGSMDWAYDSDNEIVRNLREEAPDHYDETKPLIIFGTDSKMISIDPFLGLLTKFREALQSSKLYIVIGYSFFDQYINNLIIQQLQLDPQKKLLVVDPFFGGSHSKTKRKNTCEEEFVEKILTVQNIMGYHPINLRRISKEKVIVEPITTGKFYRKYFSKGAAKLIELYERIDAEGKIF